ncbi:hypothetical protein CEK62_03550 [Alcanivorax sp. N3-2A]|nr:hypothetical protein CEK62_03550 [Alcanivorax sp. N3-2A]|tara:strand:- start:11181 stop:12443 length:1263 start_codon:yes stop_codon:yes gene_type:complete
MSNRETRVIRREARQWLAEGLIDETQASRILARYGASLDQPDPASVASRVLTTVAVLFVGLAILLLVSANWDTLPRLLRFAGLFLVTGALNGIGVVRYLRHGLGALWLFLGGISFGASIMLVGQMYQLGEHFPNGVLLWMIGLLPVALVTGQRSMALLLLALTMIWTVMEGHFTPPWLAPLFLVPVWLAARRHRSGTLMGLALAGLFVWLNLLLCWLYHTDFGPRWLAGHLTFNLALLALGHALVARARARGELLAPLSPWLERLFLLLVLPLTFTSLWPSYLRDNWGWLDPGLWAAALVLLVALIVHWRSLAIWVALPALALIHGLGRPEQSLYWGLAANLLVLLVAMNWLRQGIADDDGRRFFSGLGTLLLLGLLRYLDLIGDYLGAAALFLVMAGLLYGGACYWRRRGGMAPGGGHE